MINKERIENVLNKGKTILEEHPELRDIDIRDVIDKLDDGTKEMISNRWGVAAWLVIESIENLEIRELIERLSAIENKTLITQYVGYILQKEYGINLEALILEADKYGKFDKIIYYVADNLHHQEKYEQQYFLPFLQMLEKYSSHNAVDIVLKNYSKLIAKNNNFQIIIENLHELKTEIQYKLLNQLKVLWYQENNQQANEMIGIYINQESIWSKQAAIEYIRESLYYDTVVFEIHFPRLKIIAQENMTLWDRMVSVFINYVQLKKQEIPMNHITVQVLKELEQIPNGVTTSKYAFINCFYMIENPTEDIKNIYQKIILKPFENKEIPYNTLKIYYYEQIKDGLVQQALKELETIFCVNNFLGRYYSFFDGFNFAFEEIKNSEFDITKLAFDCILSNRIDRFFFGVGLFVNVVNLEDYLLNSKTEKMSLSDKQLLRIMKGLLYFSIHSEFICRTTFQLLALSKDACKEYFQFCIEEVYANYLFTLYKISCEYITATNEKQVQLAELIKREYDQLLSEQEKVHMIKDLQSSHEHQKIYSKIRVKQNQDINKIAIENSVLRELFPVKMMKYGIRSSHIIKDSNAQMHFQDSPYHSFTSKMELPIVYMYDPVKYEIEKIKYIEDVKNDEIDH